MIHIALSTDSNYLKQCYTLISSASEFTSTQIHFHIVCNNVSVDNMRPIENLIKSKHHMITKYPFENIVGLLKTDGAYNLSSYARLFLPNLLDNSIEKILYCDCDMIFLDDPYKIYSINIDRYYCGGVIDVVDDKYKKLIGMGYDDSYINAGMVLLNLSLMRENMIVDKFLNCIEDYHGSVPHHDQGVINKVCKDNIKIVNPEFNLLCPNFSFTVNEIIDLYGIQYYSESEVAFAKNNPVLVHFTNDFFNRPWNKYCSHPLKNSYLKFYIENPYDSSLGEDKLIYKALILKRLKKILPFKLYKGIYKCIQKVKKK